MDERFTFVLSADLKKKIEEIAKEMGMPASSYVRMIIIDNLKKTESNKRGE